MVKTEITNIRAYKEYGTWYLDITATKEDDKEIVELHIPKASFVSDSRLDFGREVSPFYGEDTRPYVDIGTGSSLRLHLYRGASMYLDDSLDKIIYYEQKVIETKTHEMTLKEIEKKLGYKVKIVSEKK